jgi:chloramphenicol O-acetyltransferase
MYWPTKPGSIPLEELGWVKTLYLASSTTLGDPTIVWGTSVETEMLEQFIAEQRRQTGSLISVAQVLIWVVAQALKKHDVLNRRVIGHRIYSYDGVSLTMPIMETRVGEVNIVYLRHVERMSLTEISRAVWEKAREAAVQTATEKRHGVDKSWQKRWREWLRMQWVVRMADLGFYLTNTFRLPTTTIDEINGCSAFVNYLGFAGAPPMIGYKPSSLPSNSFGVNVTMGASELKPVVENGAVTARSIAPLFVRVDHRVANGYQTSQFLNTLRNSLQNPASLLVEPPPS